MCTILLGDRETLPFVFCLYGRLSIFRCRSINHLQFSPFHDDKNPSLVITPSAFLWNCLGACQEGGSVIDWVMKSQGVSFPHAVELLRSGPSKLPKQNKAPKKTTVTHLDLLIDPVNSVFSRLGVQIRVREWLLPQGLTVFHVHKPHDSVLQSGMIPVTVQIDG